MVDNEPICLNGMCALLKSCKIDLDKYVDIALDGQEAVESVTAALNMNLTYSLILTDVSMPRMDGLEAT